MLIDGEDEVYFFDRDNCVFKVQGIRFLNRTDLNRHLVNTLVDGVFRINFNHNVDVFNLFIIITGNGN